MSAVIEYTVQSTDIGKSVGELLKRKFNMSTSVLRALKRENKIFLNNAPCKSVDKVNINDIVSADVSEEADDFGNISPFEGELDIIYEDDFILAVNKPGNMESHPCPSNRESTLANIIMYYWAQKGEYHNYHIVNRLDKGTSGICIIAKNPFSHGSLSEQIKNGSFKKQYTAVVHGSLDRAEGVIDLPIGRSSSSIIKRVVKNDGKPAKTVYKTLAKTKKYSLIEVIIETGRTHQIRVHFSHLGHPLVGDWLYGDGDNERDLITRQALHAKRIEFLHPATGEAVFFLTDTPMELKKLLNLD